MLNQIYISIGLSVSAYMRGNSYWAFWFLQTTHVYLDLITTISHLILMNYYWKLVLAFGFDEQLLGI